MQRNGRTASGDLYQRPVENESQPILQPPPSPALGIPILGLGHYRYYIRIEKITEKITPQNSIELEYQMWRFDHGSRRWAIEGGPSASFRATMSLTTAPEGFPSANDYLEGDVVSDITGSIVGRLKMGWISSSFRKATIEIDKVRDSETPEDNGNDQTWTTVFSEIGWDVTVEKSDITVPEPSGKSWSDAELHSAMLRWRDHNNLDAEWRFHILVVNHIDSTPRGIMYDAGATDSDQVPREGVGISSHWIFPPTRETGEPDWGLVKGQRFGTASAPYFRTAVHELGHALGLLHNTFDLGFMNTTDVIAAAGTQTSPFPDNIKWSFAENDLKRLRHYPDPFVRPGGIPFGMASQLTPPLPIGEQAIGLTLDVKPLLSEVPLGAPVRMEVTLSNKSEVPILAPRVISLKSGFVRGSVKDASGNSRMFSPLVHCVDCTPMENLKRGETRTGSLTLLRGSDGALFPSAGMTKITVQVSWSIGNRSIEQAMVVGESTVLVTEPKTPKDAAVAHKVLATPDTHLVLVLGGYHLKDGMSAIAQALSNEILRPHFAAIEAKRLVKPFLEVKPEISKASKLMRTKGVVISPAEDIKLRQLFAKVG
jgi:hypothetical protein